MAAMKRYCAFGTQVRGTVRKGAVGDHVNYLSKAQRARMDRHCAARLGDLPELEPLWPWMGITQAKL